MMAQHQLEEFNGLVAMNKLIISSSNIPSFKEKQDTEDQENDVEDIYSVVQEIIHSERLEWQAKYAEMNLFHNDAIKFAEENENTLRKQIDLLRTRLDELRVIIAEKDKVIAKQMSERGSKSLSLSSSPEIIARRLSGFKTP